MQNFKLLLILLLFTVKGFSQVADSTNFSIYYSSPKEYIIESIEIKGIRYLDKDVLTQLSGLSVGDEIEIPGEAITNAIKKLWTQGLFSDVKIEAEKIIDNRVWLAIYLQERPRLADVNFHGVSKSEQDDITEKVLLLKGSQVTDNQLNQASRIIKDIFHEKGFLNTEVNIVQRDDSVQANSVILEIMVDKKEKVKIDEIVFHGTENLSPWALEKSMKKTKAKKLRNFFSSKKFLEEKYAEDKVNLIKKYNEKGYRDATVVKDSISPASDNRVRLDIWVDEGDKYYFGDIKWVGNTVYPGEFLGAVLGVKKGDVFDQKLLDKRLTEDEDGVGSQYQNNGYLFYNLDPVETRIENDTINLEMRIYEGKQATINKIIISGNTKTHEHVARREIRTLPGDLFSKDLLMRSYRELSQLGHFDPEAINPNVVPHPEDGTVDIDYQLVEKANDQIELSGGWGARMFVGSVGLKFSNFSVRNIMNKEAWRPLPTGDGQTLGIRAQTSGKFYQQYSFSFTEPWLGGKKPNSFSLSVSHSRVNYSANNYYNSYSSPYGSGYGGYGGGYGGYGGYSPYGYGGYSPYGYSGYGGYGGSPYGYGYGYGYGQEYVDPKDRDESQDQIQVTTAIALGYGYRLEWPDDYFTVYHELSWQHYKLQNMSDYYYFLNDGTGSGDGQFNNFSFKTVFGRNSVDNPLYSRSGSSLSLSLQLTPPYSLINGVDYSNPTLTNDERYKWIEYHKWMLKGAWYTPVSRDNKLVLHGKFEYGFLGYYDENRRSPFEGFRVGGSGMSGYNLYGSDIVSLRGYKDYSLSPNTGSNIYNKLTLEMRYPVSLKPSATIYLLTFLEAGNAWMEFKDFTPFKLKRSAGAGVRIFLPMFGLMGIDWGYGFDSISGSNDYGGSQFHFVIGQQF
ncbi:MAG: outer membrane protein assembly factor BamA [Bacteroidetes bacterium GWF2_42_66]|nr:MAG: outer membrane protein assembly factor BamA [Bacteroidetes bacterium GWA2_42_15]OFY01269.1 MAG: outer membrane protein assembly factor BamA [Bacteroidetes bacterium GWE2_42_39]OFY42112.1 MAG: outer membrane protein assembly factor BamA [Bacteroidetes bacterium GWF2_42_66]HBL77684.1 outer membrane protein assembly factor BamA [Prolixibacteraceae bacterium]HCB62813.1 outer membrane protein assembly factor BamA [Bacteroidales bacterium]